MTSKSKKTKLGADYRIDVRHLTEKYIFRLEKIKSSIEKELSKDGKNNFNTEQLNCVLKEAANILALLTKKELSFGKLNLISTFCSILTKREKEIVWLFVFDELNTDEIAKKLVLSPRTVENHFANILLSIQKNKMLSHILADNQGEIKRSQDIIKRVFSIVHEDKTSKEIIKGFFAYKKGVEVRF